MIAQDYANKPIDEALLAVQLPEVSRELLTHSYAWIETANAKLPLASLISPAGFNERGLNRFLSNAEANHHDLHQFMRTHLLTDDDDRQIADTLYSQTTPTEGVHRLLGAYLYQFSEEDGLFLPFLDALALADVDVVGVMVLLLEQGRDEKTGDLAADLTEQMARFLAHQMAGQIQVLDHYPTDADMTLPAYMLVPLRNEMGDEFDVPMALVDWLQDNLVTLKALPEDHRQALLDLVAKTSDGNGVIINEWLGQDDGNEQALIEFIDSQLQHLQA